jgi:hypothetical protein
MKYWNSAFNAQGSRGIKIAVDVGVVKIYVAAMEALRKKRKRGWNSSLPQKLMVFWDSPPPPPLSSSNVNVHVCRFFWKFILCTTQLRVLVLCFPYFTDNSIIRILWQCKMARKYSAWQGTSRHKGKENCPFFLWCRFVVVIVIFFPWLLSAWVHLREGAGTRVNQHLL